MLTHDNGRQLIVIGHLNDYMVTQKVLQMKYFERLTIQNDFKVTRVTSISLDSQNDDEQINLWKKTSYGTHLQGKLQWPEYTGEHDELVPWGPAM